MCLSKNIAEQIPYKNNHFDQNTIHINNRGHWDELHLTYNHLFFVLRCTINCHFKSRQRIQLTFPNVWINLLHITVTICFWIIWIKISSNIVTYFMTMLSNKMNTSFFNSACCNSKGAQLIYHPIINCVCKIISSECPHYWELYQKLMVSDIKCTDSF